MTEKEYKEHIQYTHNAYCRIVIRHASIDAARMLYAKWKRKISLEYLSEEKFMPFGTTDEYFAQPPINEDYPFTACGQIVLLSDPALAAALSMLFQGKQPHQAAQPEKAGSRVYRYRLWLLAGCVRRAHPVFCYVFDLLIHGSDCIRSNTL